MHQGRHHRNPLCWAYSQRRLFAFIANVWRFSLRLRPLHVHSQFHSGRQNDSTVSVHDLPVASHGFTVNICWHQLVPLFHLWPGGSIAAQARSQWDPKWCDVNELEYNYNGIYNDIYIYIIYKFPIINWDKANKEWACSRYHESLCSLFILRCFSTIPTSPLCFCPMLNFTC